MLHGWRGTDPSKQAVPWCQTPLISTDGLCPPCQAPLGHHLAEPKVLERGWYWCWAEEKKGKEGRARERVNVVQHHRKRKSNERTRENT